MQYCVSFRVEPFHLTRGLLAPISKAMQAPEVRAISVAASWLAGRAFDPAWSMAFERNDDSTDQYVLLFSLLDNY